ncbi:efflux RND transporter permease subunit [Treponema endosymbiont of Eucomonympha sp.]|uniref:efflux RND transporter permease subunit n=2 Tax=Treponema endosymbiont of Eucomonympha sp. TaxID=1580831 RepID=UPI0007802E9A|nr:efflux RND transporter permease subunit [Treponema endosymbiont of Eucomonympha sp.]
MNIPKLAVSKPTTVLIIFILLAALGVYTAIRLPIDLMPDMEIPYIAVMTTYPGAGPEEVERGVTRPLESTLSSVTGLKVLHSTSSSGQSVVFLELNYGTNLDSAGNEMRDRIDLVKEYLPGDAGTPTILKIDPSMIPIMALVLRGSRTPEELRALAEDIVQSRLEQVDGIASVNITGGREKSINIDIPRDRLEAYSLTVTQIQQMLGAQNAQISGGTLSEGDKSYTITTSGQYRSLDDIRNTVISYKAAQYGVSASAESIRLRDIADVYEGFKPVSTIAYVDGAPCVMLSVQKQGGKNSVQVSDRAKRQVAEMQKTLPQDVELAVAFDTTDMIRTSISQVTSTVLQGAILAIIILFIFLRSIKSTLIIGITIPLALVITLMLMYFCGFTLNIMTLAGLCLGVGMLVDNSIVILENIYSYRERGAKVEVSAVLGSREMLMAITASTLTTVCVFLPMIMLSSQLGMYGQIFSGLTFTIVFSLLCSLAVAVVLVPVLSAKYLKLENVGARKRGVAGVLDGALGRFFQRLDDGYAGVVRGALRHKKPVVLAVSLLFIGSVALVATGAVPFILMPSQNSDRITVDVALPKGTRIETTEALCRQIEDLARREIKGVKSSRLSAGNSGMLGTSGSASSGSVSVELYPDKERRKNGYDGEAAAKEKLRRHFNSFPGATLSFGESGMSMGSGSGGVDVEIRSDDLALARDTANAIVALLKDKAADYVTDPKSSLEDGLPQVDIEVDRSRLYDLGLNIAGVGNEIRANINGATAGRYQDAGKEIDIVVALSEDDRAHLNDLSGIFVNNSSGQRIPVSSFASYRETTSPVSISREDQTRTVHVTATPQKLISGADGKRKPLSIGAVQQQVERVVRENLPEDNSVRITYAGDSKQFFEYLQTFLAIIVMAVALVFAVMASQFESFKDPFIVIFCIPLSFVGIVMLHLLTGETLSIITAVGLLILVGIIVNNGIVLVDYTNLLRKRGLALEEACAEAARNRLRPILMTTLTTVLGLLPMAFFPGEGSEMTQPIGKTVLGGLSFGTLMTLFLMPVLYAIFNKKSERKRLARSQRPGS